ncbi:hypothetical protein VTG60DRAFT_3640 [Thermothelomyces hinnuleus]
MQLEGWSTSNKTICTVAFRWSKTPFRDWLAAASQHKGAPQYKRACRSTISGGGSNDLVWSVAFPRAGPNRDPHDTLRQVARLWERKIGEHVGSARYALRTYLVSRGTTVVPGIQFGHHPGCQRPLLSSDQQPAPEPYAATTSNPRMIRSDDSSHDPVLRNSNTHPTPDAMRPNGKAARNA